MPAWIYDEHHPASRLAEALRDKLARIEGLVLTWDVGASHTSLRDAILGVCREVRKE